MFQKIIKKFILIGCIFSFFLSACQSSTGAPSATPTSQALIAAPTATTAAPATEWMAPAVPDALRQAGAAPGLTLVSEASAASAQLDIVRSADVVEGHPVFSEGQAVWFYALVAPFPTVTDGLSFDELKQAWGGQAPSVFAGRPLVMSASTYDAMQSVFGGQAAAGAVRILPAEGLVEALWQDRPQWGILPFESLDPKLKVLEVDGQSPVHKVFDEEKYPLKTAFVCQGADCGAVSLPATNRDPSKLTTIVMTGVTALVRATALKMELKGVNYPGEGIRDWLLGADIAHISNEIPFAVGCPYPDAYQTRLIFCSDPKYMDLLKYVGADVIELTGNHFEDWGKEATLHTLDMYKEAGLPYFGGGSDLADSQKPALLERNGVKFAFIGCDPAGPDFAWARDDGWPGAAPCGTDWAGAAKGGDGYEWMVAEIKKLHAEGYIVIATFQYFEYYSPDPRPWQQEAFREMADAGATIVSGSQAHYSQAMEFDHGSFIHYGLGNLFFDQMGYDNPSSGLRTTNTRREFLDRHIFYDGKYVGTELLTAELEDWAQPRPMTPEERQAFLSEYFTASGW